MCCGFITETSGLYYKESNDHSWGGLVWFGFALLLEFMSFLFKEKASKEWMGLRFDVGYGDNFIVKLNP